MNKKWITAIALILGCGAGGLGVANMIDIFKPYTILITAGGVFLGVAINFFVAKANAPEVNK